MRWNKCHIYGTPNTINACRSTQNPNLPNAITMYEDLNIEWLKAQLDPVSGYPDGYKGNSRNFKKSHSLYAP